MNILIWILVHIYIMLLFVGCRELGIGIVPYSPLGQGFFCAGSKVAEGMKDDDLRRVICHLEYHFLVICLLEVLEILQI